MESRTLTPGVYVEESEDRSNLLGSCAPDEISTHSTSLYHNNIIFNNDNINCIFHCEKLFLISRHSHIVNENNCSVLFTYY